MKNYKMKNYRMRNYKMKNYRMRNYKMKNYRMKNYEPGLRTNMGSSPAVYQHGLLQGELPLAGNTNIWQGNQGNSGWGSEPSEG
ncbi:unnamed protein product [Boreogadus saida]